jgi:hypothetical protein
MECEIKLVVSMILEKSGILKLAAVVETRLQEAFAESALEPLKEQ